MECTASRPVHVNPEAEALLVFRFKCSTCDEVHEGIPTFGWDYPIHYLQIPEAERDDRCHLGSDDCVIDDQWFFVRGCIEIPVHGYADPFIWGVWVSLSEESFNEWSEVFEVPNRSNCGPYFGWLSSHLALYPDTINLKTYVHLRDNGIRPWLELEPTEHPLAVEQREGMSPDRVAEIYEQMLHG